MPLGKRVPFPPRHIRKGNRILLWLSSLVCLVVMLGSVVLSRQQHFGDYEQDSSTLRGYVLNLLELHTVLSEHHEEAGWRRFLCGYTDSAGVALDIRATYSGATEADFLTSDAHVERALVMHFLGDENAAEVLRQNSPSGAESFYGQLVIAAIEGQLDPESRNSIVEFQQEHPLSLIHI